MTSHLKKHGVKLLRPLIPLLPQARPQCSSALSLPWEKWPPFLCPAYRQVASGGWLQDLTLSDPTYVLPLVSLLQCVLLPGAETGSDRRRMRNIMRLMPLAVLPINVHFPSAVFMYLLSSIPVLKIPHHVVRDSNKLPPVEAFRKSFKRGWKKVEITHQLHKYGWCAQNHVELAAKGSLWQTLTHNPLL